MLKTVCFASALALTPVLAQANAGGWLARPLRPRPAPVSRAVHLARDARAHPQSDAPLRDNATQA